VEQAGQGPKAKKRLEGGDLRQYASQPLEGQSPIWPALPACDDTDQTFYRKISRRQSSDDSQPKQDFFNQRKHPRLVICRVMRKYLTQNPVIFEPFDTGKFIDLYKKQ
jgi:hypothetical protein